MPHRPAQIWTGSAWDDIGDARVGVQPINTQTANYTLALSDIATRVQMNNSAARTITIPLNSSVNFPVGTRIDIANINTGVLTVAAASGATVNGRALTLGQWETATLVQRAANTWVLEQHADLTAALGSKISFEYGTSEPTTTVVGFVWFDTNFTPPVAKVWNGSAFVNFSQGPADFSDAATGTYTDSGIDYKYITYTASGTLTVTRAGFADVLVVGGGGGGGGAANSSGGGGGGGFHLYTTSLYLPAESLTVTVGGGGAGGSAAQGVNGSFSRLSFVSAFGGGGGGGGSAINGLVGTSGGGGGSFGASNGNGAAAIDAFFGNSGGNGAGGGNAGGGGGGNSGGGANATSAVGGNGGAGSANSITNTSVTRAGGGGGGGSSTRGTGGSGGGGNGELGSSGNGSAGSANTGGGGGGRSNSATVTGYNGGSGVVIVRVRT